MALKLSRHNNHVCRLFKTGLELIQSKGQSVSIILLILWYPPPQYFHGLREEKLISHPRYTSTSGQQGALFHPFCQRLAERSPSGVSLVIDAKEKEREFWNNKCPGPDMTHIMSTPRSLARVSQMGPPTTEKRASAILPYA